MPSRMLRSLVAVTLALIGATSCCPIRSLILSEARTPCNKTSRLGHARVRHPIREVATPAETVFCSQRQYYDVRRICLRLGSKLRLVKDCVPFTSHDSNKRFLEQEFKEHIFSAENLAKLSVALSRITSAKRRMWKARCWSGCDWIWPICQSILSPN